jgi:DNA-directed RNA polymerase alpha subunit
LSDLIVRNNKGLNLARTENQYEHLQGAIMDAEKVLPKIIELMGEKNSIVVGYGLDTDILDLGLSFRAYRALSELEVKTLGGILATTPRQIKKVRDVGKGTVKEIEALLKSRGFEWGFKEGGEK